MSPQPADKLNEVRVSKIPPALRTHMNQANLAILERVRSNHTSGGVFSDRLRRTWGGRHRFIPRISDRFGDKPDYRQSHKH